MSPRKLRYSLDWLGVPNLYLFLIARVSNSTTRGLIKDCDCVRKLMCMTVFPRTNRLNFPIPICFFFFCNCATSTKVSLNLFLSNYPFVFIDFITHDTHTHTHTYRMLNPKSTAKKASKKKREVDRPVFMTSTDKNPKRGRSIGFDSTRDCACLPLVDRTYVGTYVLCIRIYTCV